MKKCYLVLLIFSFLAVSTHADAQKRRGKDQEKPKQEKKEDKSPLNERTFAGLKMRNIGPAFTSGRIADIAIHPDHGRQTGRKMQVRGLVFDAEGEKFRDIHSIHPLVNSE